MQLKDFGAIQQSTYRGKNKTYKQQTRTAFIFNKGYKPLIIGDTVLLDDAQIMLCLEFKSKQALKAWGVFEDSLNETTFQIATNILKDLSTNPYLLVSNVKALTSQLLETSNRFVGFIDASTGQFYDREAVA